MVFVLSILILKIPKTRIILPKFSGGFSSSGLIKTEVQKERT